MNFNYIINNFVVQLKIIKIVKFYIKWYLSFNIFNINYFIQILKDYNLFICQFHIYKNNYQTRPNRQYLDLKKELIFIDIHHLWSFVNSKNQLISYLNFILIYKVFIFYFIYHSIILSLKQLYFNLFIFLSNHLFLFYFFSFIKAHHLFIQRFIFFSFLKIFHILVYNFNISFHLNLIHDFFKNGFFFLLFFF